MSGLIDIFNRREVLPFLEYGAALALFLVFCAGRLSKLTSLKMLTEPGLFVATGKMGRGKSYLMTLFVYYALRQRRLVFSNYYIEGCRTYDEFFEWLISVGREVMLDKKGAPIGWRVPKEHAHDWRAPVLFENWSQIVDAPMGSMVLIDEAQSWWRSTDFASPAVVEEWITRLRKRRITCVCASQDFSLLGRFLRILAAGVWECRRTGSVHRYTLVDTSQVGKSVKTQKTMARFRCRRKRRVMALYDTYEAVAGSREWGAAVATEGGAGGDSAGSRAPASGPTDDTFT